MKRILVILTVLALATVACQLTGVTRAPTTAPVPSPAPSTQGSTSQPQQVYSSTLAEPGNLTDLYETALPGVVSIRVSTDNGGGIGSGFVFDGQGHVVTNFHVVEGANEVEVDFSSGFKTYGTVIGTDLDSYNLAVRLKPCRLTY